MLAWKRSWASRVPLGGLREWCEYAFGFPDRHPRRLVACGFPDAPGGTPSACGPRAGSSRGAWWFENWIVDASNAGFFHPACFIAISPGSFLESGFEIDRFVIIFLQCDDLSSGVESCYQVFRGVCRPEGRMVDALADSTDEGRLRMR